MNEARNGGWKQAQATAENEGVGGALKRKVKSWLTVND